MQTIDLAASSLHRDQIDEALKTALSILLGLFRVTASPHSHSFCQTGKLETPVRQEAPYMSRDGLSRTFGDRGRSCPLLAVPAQNEYLAGRERVDAASLVWRGRTFGA